MTNCEICGKKLELDPFPLTQQARWCMDCINAGLTWGMERYALWKEAGR